MPPTELPDFDKLWNYQDPASTEKKFRELLPADEASGDASYLAQLLTQIARTQGLQDRFDEAHATLDRVEKMLTPRLGVARIRYLLERGRAFNSSGQPAKALPLFREAARVAEGEGQIRFRIDAVHMLAIAEPAPQEQLKWNLLGLALVDSNPGERRWLWSLHNNTGETYLLLHEYERALEHFQKLVEVTKERTGEPDIFAQKDVGKCLRLLGRYDEAIELLKSLD